jgi:hypothetical protein
VIEDTGLVAAPVPMVPQTTTPPPCNETSSDVASRTPPPRPTRPNSPRTGWCTLSSFSLHPRWCWACVLRVMIECSLPRRLWSSVVMVSRMRALIHSIIHTHTHTHTHVYLCLYTHTHTHTHTHTLISPRSHHYSLSPSFTMLHSSNPVRSLCCGLLLYACVYSPTAWSTCGSDRTIP